MKNMINFINKFFEEPIVNELINTESEKKYLEEILKKLLIDYELEQIKGELENEKE